MRNEFLRVCNTSMVSLSNEGVLAEDDNPSPEKLACIKAAIDRVMTRNGLEEEWEDYQLELAEALGELNACQKIEDQEKSEE